MYKILKILNNTYFTGELLTPEEKEAVTYYLQAVKKDPIFYLDEIYRELYEMHPEVKALEQWKTIRNVFLKNYSAYKRALKHEADVYSKILHYLDTPYEARSIFYTYGIQLKERGYTWQYFFWYVQIKSRRMEEAKDMKLEVVTGLEKLYPYTTQVIQEALGKVKIYESLYIYDA